MAGGVTRRARHPRARSTSPPSGPGWTKDRAAAEKEAAQCRAKLDNAAFIGKAPEPVVGKIRDRLAAAEADLARIAAALAALPS